MKSSNKINIIIIVVCAVLVIGFCTFLIVNHKENVLTDAQKFKAEYEVYNGYVNPNTNEEFLTVNIDAENPMIYKTDEEIVDILQKEDALILFGYPASIVNRSVIETLLESAKEAEITEIYYVDILEIRDEYVYSGDVNVTQTKEGTESYKAIVDFLDEYLNNYYVLADDGKLLDTEIKRLNAPTIVAVSKGEIVGFYEGALENSDKELSEEEKEKLKDIYLEIMNNWLDKTTVCSSSTSC